MEDVTSLLGLWLEPVGQALNDEAARRLVDLRADVRMQARVEGLADRNTEGLLTPEERSEYEGLVAAATLIDVLKVRGPRRLSSQPTAA